MESEKTIPLIWSHNIASGKLSIPIKKDKKPQYIKKDDFDIGPAIIVNRIVGSVKSAKIKSAIVPTGMKFLAENHTNVIYPPKQSLGSNKISLKEINNQINSCHNLEILKSITGNTQVSKNELEKIFPIRIV